ncbi:Short chain dehydrogenase [Coniochaeta hoffmannii]|uniref:Short chain dehydrogenase n=1 Tax=Coniochaeta hoffmannii TaxID=91930 RepID=A0AA38R8T5_9PEZI|nr:Short chain dehydrogenase [Coniochaeta hoffmannii]
MIPAASYLLRLPRMASRAYSSKLSYIASRLPEYNPVTTRGFHNTARRLTASASSEQPTLLPEFSLKGKVIVVSGGGRGLGLVQSEALLEAGAAVHAIDLLEPSSEFAQVADRAASELGSSFTYHQLNVRDNALLNDTVAGIADKHGRIDGLIAAAGIQQETPALEYSQEDCDKMMGVNVTGVFMTAQAVARQMIKRKQGGSVVLIGSMSGTVANRGLICPAYNASKAGVIQLARNLAAEWGEHGIRVNTISPGYIVTAMTAGLFDAFPERRKDWPNANMLGRLSYPEEYRGAAVFLLSDASSFMTGADLRIDGGHCAW